MSKDILLPSTKEFTENDVKILTCSRMPRNALNRLRQHGNRFGDVRQCAGFDTEVTFITTTLGGLCQHEPEDDVKRLCDGASVFLPDAESLRERKSMKGIGIVFKDGSELILKKHTNAWKPFLNVPKQGMSKVTVSTDLISDVKSSHPNNDIDTFLEISAGQGSIPEVKIPDDEFGKSLQIVADLDLVTLTGCHRGDTCIKLTPKGLHAYNAFNRGKPNDGLGSEKNISRSGGVSMEFEGLYTGLEKSGSGSRRIWFTSNARRDLRDAIASKAGVSSSTFNIEGETGRTELKNVGDWMGRNIPKMIDEIEVHEKFVASRGITRPEFSSIVKPGGGTKLSGGIHITFTVPVTKIDKDNKEQWDLFMANWLRMSQWWEPLLLGASGSPSSETSRPNNWLHSIRHHISWSVKAGIASIKRLIQDDGSVGVYSGSRTDWHRKSENEGGKFSTGGGRADFRTEGRGGITWAGSSRSECQRKNFPEIYCQNQTDAGVELRFFEYEPLPNLEERASVIPLIMDRAYQLAAQDIEVPEPRDKGIYNDLMWKMMKEGDQAKLNSNEAKTFSKVFSRKNNLIRTGEDIFTAGRKVVEDLWANHYDDFFSSYFGVDNKPTHMNYMKVSKEGIKEARRTGRTYHAISDSSYAKGGKIS